MEGVWAKLAELCLDSCAMPCVDAHCRFPLSSFLFLFLLFAFSLFNVCFCLLTLRLWLFDSSALAF
jgi:hypothetical protein